MSVWPGGTRPARASRSAAEPAGRPDREPAESASRPQSAACGRTLGTARSAAIPARLAVGPQSPIGACSPREDPREPKEAEMADKLPTSETEPAGAAPSAGWRRREVLKGAAAAAGLAAGSGALGGFPTIWAQNIKDVTLLQVGGSYSAIIDIARQASEDLGFKVEMQNVGRDALVNRVVTQPKSLDIADLEYWLQMHAGPARRACRAIDLTKYQVLGQGRPDLHQGQVSGRPQGLGPGHPALRGAVRRRRRTPRVRRRARPTARPRIPTVYNADTLGIRPDLSAATIEQLEGAAQPRVQGQDGAGRHALDRHHGRRDGDRVARRHQIRRQGQHDQGGDRQDHRRS